MTKRDCVQLISIITVRFPSYLKGMSDVEKQGAVNLWMEFIGDLPAELGYLRVKEYLHTAETLYQSDNVPLRVEQIAKDIQRAIKREFALSRFAVPEVNEYVDRERAIYRASLPPKAEIKYVPSHVYDNVWSRKLVEEGILTEDMIRGDNEEVLAVREERTE